MKLGFNVANLHSKLRELFSDLPDLDEENAEETNWAVTNDHLLTINPTAGDIRDIMGFADFITAIVTGE
jgi:hypothetical protein